MVPREDILQLLHFFFGLDSPQNYDPELREQQLVREGLDALTADFARAWTIDLVIDAGRTLRREEGISPSLGFRHEILRIVRKIMDPSNRRVRGDERVIAVLTSEGALADNSSPSVDILVSSPGKNSVPAIVHFDQGGAVAPADYYFSQHEIDTAVEAELARAYPQDFGSKLAAAAERVQTTLGELLKKTSSTHGFEKILSDSAQGLGVSGKAAAIIAGEILDRGGPEHTAYLLEALERQ